jgi:NADH dehydrogenase [ubiquinone] 1 alpha subcomplex assembly factor 5
LPPAIGAEAVHIGSDDAAAGAARWEREVEGPADKVTQEACTHPPLVARDSASHKGAAVATLFDIELRALRRDRAARIGPELFLFERTFDDCLERIALQRRRFERALLIGCADPAWPARLRSFANDIEVHDPGHLFAEAAAGTPIVEDQWAPSPASFDLVVALGTLDTVNDLPRALRSIRTAMRPQSLLIGAMSGGDTLPQLRNAMRAADQVTGAATAHVHPRIEASAVAPLLSAAGFFNPVVDVDRFQIAYASFGRLVADLRAMGATNVLAARSRRPLLRAARTAADRWFIQAGDGRRTTETFEILHFAAWTQTAVPTR